MYWLRPENAVITTILANRLVKLPCEDPVLDMSCGDGTLMFTLFNGVFSDEFDIFASTANLEKVRSDNTDIYDYVDKEYQPKIIAKPARKIDYGFDIKKSMLHKAKSLGLYQTLINGDVCKGIGLVADTIGTIYINHTINAYVDLNSALQEIRRVLKQNGRAYISVYDLSIIGFINGIYDAYSENLAKIIDRGLLSTFFLQRYSFSEWLNVFEKNGLKIENVYPLVGRDFVPYWCIGMRPVAPMLIKMSNSLRDCNSGKIQEIKREWVEMFLELAKPFIKNINTPEKSATYLFELSK